MNPNVEQFIMTITVTAADIDQMEHVNNVVYVRWVQDLAVAHWRAAASPEDQARLLWVVMRHEIDYKRPAVLGDEIIGRTWVGTASRLAFERHSEFVRVSDGAILAQARTVWCPIDAKTHRPTNVSPRVRAQFSASK